MKNAMWEETDDLVGLRPVFQIICPFCGTQMKLRYCHHTKLSDTAKSKTPREMTVGHADNQHYKCPGCDYVAAFGVPVSPQYYAKISEARQKAGWKGRYVPIKEWDEDEIIIERLKAWGYW